MRINKVILLTAAIALIISLPLQPMTSSAEQLTGDGQIDLQLVSDQLSVQAGGKIDYHIIYDAGSDLLAPLHVQVQVPDHIEVPSTLEVDWDSTARLLTWTIPSDQMASGAGVINFSLHAAEELEEGASLALAATASLNGELTTTPDVTVEVGPEQHQPFFLGYPDGTFRPASDLTRAETAAVVARIENLEDTTPLEEPYMDVEETHWAHEYIAKVTHAGYMQGYEGQFRPSDPITRAEFITIVLNIRGIEPVKLPTLTDAEEHWADSMIETAKALNYIEADMDSFVPDASIPRDESTRLLNLAFFRGELVDGAIPVEQHFPDVPTDHWAFHWIEEASMTAHESSRSGLEEELIQYLPEITEPF